MEELVRRCNKMGYNPNSMKAEEFINNEEILECLSYAGKNKNNMALAKEILEKAKKARVFRIKRQQFYLNVKFQRLMMK